MSLLPLTRQPRGGTLLPPVRRTAAVAILFAVGATSTAPIPCRAVSDSRVRPDTVRVLILGNSFAYYNNMPRMLEAVAASRRGPVIRTTIVGKGGATLEDHWRDTAAQALLRRGRWDWVVLNEQSTFGEVYLVNGRSRVHGWSRFADYASRYTTVARAGGARVALLVHWANRDAPARDQAAIDYAITSVARASGATVIPTSLAWQALLRVHPELDLYDVDGHHPSAAGSYLEAATLYATLIDRSPVGATDTVVGPIGMADDGIVHSDSIVTLVALAPDQARMLQALAWTTHEQLAARHGRPRVTRPGPITLPSLPPGGVPPTPTQLAGIWRGQSTLYPSASPAPTELWIGAKGDSLWGRIRVVVGPAAVQIHEGPVSVTITAHGVQITDPDGPNHGTVRYRGVVRGAVSQGVADFIVPDPMVHGIGTWILHHDS